MAGLLYGSEVWLREVFGEQAGAGGEKFGG